MKTKNTTGNSVTRTKLIAFLGSLLILSFFALGLPNKSFANTQHTLLQKEIINTKIHYAKTLRKIRTLESNLALLKKRSLKRILKPTQNSYIVRRVDNGVQNELQSMRDQLMEAAQQYGESLKKLSKLKTALTKNNINSRSLNTKSSVDLTERKRTIQTPDQVIEEYAAVQSEFSKLRHHFKSTLGQLEILEKDIESSLRNEGITSADSSNINSKINSGLGVNTQTTRRDTQRAAVSIASLSEYSPRSKSKLSIELGSEYKHYDRSQLTLNGFLALDAIFLGDIAVEGVTSDTYSTPLQITYGVTPNFIVFTHFPFIERRMTYTKGGINGSSTETTTTDINQKLKLGDISSGWNYKFFEGSAKLPSLSWGLVVTAPTGIEPYGIPVNIIELDDEGLTRFSVPDSLPTGNGVWSIKNSLAILKTADPAVLFANIGYTHNLKEQFSDLDSDRETQTPGTLDLGNMLDLGFGLALGLNQNTSVSFALNNRISEQTKSESIVDGVSTLQTINGSNGNSSTLNLGVNYAISKRLSMATTVGIGLTDDAADMTFGIKFPYTF